MSSIEGVRIVSWYDELAKHRFLCWSEGDENAKEQARRHFENHDDLEILGYTIRRLLPDGTFEEVKRFNADWATGTIDWEEEIIDST